MRLDLACLRYGITLFMRHILGVDNVIPDSLSRGTLASRCTDLSLTPHLMRRFSRLYGPFTADAFASISGCNAQAARYCSSVNQPTRASLADQIVWAYPPPHLIPAVLEMEAAWGYSRLIAALPRDVRVPPHWILVDVIRDAPGLHVRHTPSLRMQRCTSVGFDLAVYLGARRADRVVVPGVTE